jgi:hypothetical protein
VVLLSGCQGTDVLWLKNLPATESVTVAPVVNATGLSLSLPPDNPLAALSQELGLGEENSVTVADVLLHRMVLAFQSHGYQATRFENARPDFANRSIEIATVVEELRAAGMKGLIVLATLHRWDDSRWVDTRAVFVSMDVTLVRIKDGAILDERTIRNQAVPVGGATTIVQVSDDAARWLAKRLF